jgi:two-component system, NtrC family, nitrogen regulation response regulator GlnG
VIVISAQNTIMTAIQAAEADAFDYLPKPFDLPDLMKRAARALEVKRRAVPKAAARARRRRRPAARGPHARDAGALPAGGAGDEHRASRAHHRRIGHRQVADRARDPRFLGPPHAALRGGAGGRLQGWTDPRTCSRGRGGSIVFDEVGDLDEIRRRASCGCSTA